MRWSEAVKLWNERQQSVNPRHCYCQPRKGTPEHAEVKMIHAEGKAAAKAAEKGAADKAAKEKEAKRLALTEKFRAAVEARRAAKEKEAKRQELTAKLRAAVAARRAQKSAEMSAAPAKPKGKTIAELRKEVAEKKASKALDTSDWFVSKRLYKGHYEWTLFQKKGDIVIQEAYAVQPGGGDAFDNKDEYHAKDQFNTLKYGYEFRDGEHYRARKGKSEADVPITPLESYNGENEEDAAIYKMFLEWVKDPNNRKDIHHPKVYS